MYDPTYPRRRVEPIERHDLHGHSRGALATRAQEEPLALRRVRPAVGRHPHRRQDARPLDRRRTGGFLQGVRHDQGVAQGRHRRSQVPALPRNSAPRSGRTPRSSGGATSWRCRTAATARRSRSRSPNALRDCLKFLEVRLVYDKRDRRYFWHIVVENGIQPKPSPGDNVVSVDLGEIHPAVVGDKVAATSSPAGSGVPKAKGTRSGWRRSLRRSPARSRAPADAGVSCVPRPG